VLDAGFGKNLSTTNLQKGIYAFIFDQKGLMGGVGIQGTKITKINPNLGGCRNTGMMELWNDVPIFRIFQSSSIPIFH
jgi:hypothetical protein